MLKIASAPEEIRGSTLMAWWNGDGAAEVIAHAGSAILLERASSQDSLAEMSRRGDDDESLSILCRTLASLHSPRNVPPPSKLPRLGEWFRDLIPYICADTRLARGSAVANDLLATSRDEVILHGDMHHENVLCFGNRGWFAIDPKGLIGERGCHRIPCGHRRSCDIMRGRHRPPVGLPCNPMLDLLERLRPLGLKQISGGAKHQCTGNAGRMARLRFSVVRAWRLARAAQAVHWYSGCALPQQVKTSVPRY